MNRDANRRCRPSSDPVPIPPNPPSELLQLLSSKSWPAVLDRLTSHPQEVGSASRFRNERGYTVLHSLVAYNRAIPGEELVPVVKRILSAAELIDWGSEYTLDTDESEINVNINTNEVEGEGTENESMPRRTGGAWRLLMDQKNKSQWSPLHLAFVQGGYAFGKVALAKSLLQMDDETEDEEDDIRSRERLLKLVDRQNRTMLHHNCENRGPNDDSFEAANFLLSLCPTMVFARDSKGNTPLNYTLSRLIDETSTKSGLALSGDGFEEYRRNYRMLKLLVSAMEREERLRQNHEVENYVPSSSNTAATGINESDEIDFNTEITTQSIDQSPIDLELAQNESGLTAAMRNAPQHETETAITNNVDRTPHNILHSVCQLRKDLCPQNGSLHLFLASSKASKYEYGKESTKELAAEQDGVGNYALHLFLSNESYVMHYEKDEIVPKEAKPCSSSQEYRIVEKLIAVHPKITSIPNDNNVLPLRLAMDTGLRNVISLLVTEYPQAVLMDPRLDNIKLFSEILICISRNLAERITNNEPENRNEETTCLNTMLFLIKSRPDVVVYGVSASKLVQEIQPPHKKSMFTKMSRFWKRDK